MTPALALEGQKLALDLHKLIQSLDPANWRAELEASAREHLARIRARLAQLLESIQSADLEGRLASLREALGHLRTVVDDMSPHPDWKAFAASVRPAYEKVAVHLKPLAVPVPSLRPTNYKRNLFHVACGTIALIILQHLLSRVAILWVASTAAVLVVLAETSRRYSPGVNEAMMKVFAPIAHPHEHHRINSASWYTIAIFGLAWFASTMAASIALLVLALADPAAGIIGRRFGRHRIRGGRSLEGSATFVLVGTLAALLVLAAYYPAVAFLPALAMALAGAVSGAVAEIWSGTWLDDNLTVPLGVAAGVALAAYFVI